MAGYVRQSAADIVAGADLLATPLNNEFNQIQTAFGVSGHNHDGTAGNAPKVDLTTSITGVLPVANGGVAGIHKVNATAAPTTGDDSGDGYAVGSLWIDTTNDQAYICVDSTLTAAVWEQIDNTGDLAAIEALSTTGMLARTGTNTWATRTITGTSSEITVTNGDGVSGNPTLSFPSSMTFAGKTIADLGTVTTADINGGTVDGTNIGATSRGTGAFTTLGANSTVTFSSGGSMTGTWSDLGTVTTVDINGGTIDGTAIGGSSASTGAFTTITASSALNPATNDAAALGTTSLGWSDVHLATGAVINAANGNAVITHSSGIWTVSTGDLRVTTAGTNSTSVVTVGGTQTLDNKTLIDTTSFADTGDSTKKGRLDAGNVTAGQTRVITLPDADLDLAHVQKALKNYISDLTLSNNGTDADHDIDITTGSAASDGTTPVLMTLASALTKRIDASWAVGTNQGGLDGTESVAGTPDANTWYHIWLIRRSDTGVVDALFSESGTSPTMPTDYDQKRWIGAVKTDGSANILSFTQSGRLFVWGAGRNEKTAAAFGTSGLSITMDVPTGFKVKTYFSMTARNTGAAISVRVYGDGQPATAASLQNASLVTPSASNYSAGEFQKITSTSGGIAAVADTNSSELWICSWAWERV